MSKRRTVLVIVAVVVVAIALGVIAIVRSTHDSGTAPATPTATAAAPTPRCGLPGTSGQEATGAITGVVWDQQTGWPLPISPTDGPSQRTKGGAWSCYTRTPSGAVLAGWVISVRASGVADDWEEVTKTQTVPGPGQAAHLQAGVPTASPVTPRGFQVAAYTDDRATIRYYLHTASGDASCTVDVSWYQDDWRLVLGDDGSTATGCTTDVPTTFTPWGPA